ncbi:hypothetical protein BEN78_05005 [Xanthomonas citri pv. mangiferaeindicae]|nr:hypothetical protein BEN78_05005 [Xanthomonas citri pv. mangiferaeindicae]
MSPSTNADADAFIADTAEVGLYTLDRWATEQERERWREARTIEAAALRDKGTRWFFTDIDLWQIGIHADLASALANRPALLQQARVRHGEYLGAKARLEELLAFFNSRILRAEATLPDGTKVATADIDHGYWRFYRDNRYAGYAGAAPPATCQKNGHILEPRLNVRPENIDPVEGLGWDLSHARRLVHVIESLDRNREAMRTVYGLDEGALPQPDLARRFAGQLLARTWNGDASQPLFTNWLSGANGWYRVAYNDGQRCAEGYPPYGLTFAFPTGGYIVWARYYPLYQTLGATLYEAALAQKGPKASFIETHYPALSNMRGVPRTTRERTARMMFLPSLVAASAHDDH